MTDTQPTSKEPTDNLWEAIYTQRAIRYWQDTPVPRDMLEKVIEAGSKAPSGSNGQPWRFMVIDDKDQRKAISAALRAVVDGNEALQQKIESGAESKDKTERLMMQGARDFFTKLEKAPAMIFPCLYQISSPTPDPTTLVAGSSIYLAVQNILLSARGLGLGTVMTTAHQMIDAQIRDIMSLPDDVYPVAMIPIGYPAANFGPTNRKPVEEILHWNKW